MTNPNMFNINNQTVRSHSLTPRSRSNALILQQDSILTALITQKTKDNTVLGLENGETLRVREGQVEGDVGDTVFFEVRKNDEGFALRQVFPEAGTTPMSQPNFRSLMTNRDIVRSLESPLDGGFDEAAAELRQKANQAISRLTRNIDRITGNVRGAAAAQLAAAGINIDKVSVALLDSVSAQLSEAVTNNSQRIVDELNQKLDGIMNLNDGQIAQMLQQDADITIDNLYTYSHSTVKETSESITENVWQTLLPEVARFFEKEGIESGEENLAKARFLLENQIPLDADNFNRLIFLSDIEGNIDMENLIQGAIELDYEGVNLGTLEVYNPGYGTESTDNANSEELPKLHSRIQMAETRLMMSYEASYALYDSELEIDLDPQIEALKELKAKETELLAALKEVAAHTEEDIKAMADTFKSIFTLPHIGQDVYAAIAQKQVEFTPSALENYIAATTYEANATVASLKYGDKFNKIAEQFAPMLKTLGLPNDEDSIRAAAILTANNMELNAENLEDIKTIDAKVADVQSRLHPRIAAQMIADGMIPANMHIDEILSHIDQYNDQFGTNDNDKLYRHIVEMEAGGDVPPQVHEQVIEIYQMLRKISKNNGAGIGFAVNAGIDLTLHNLMNFSKNYDASSAKRNTINYTVEDDVYYAKHLVSSFISAARPRPLAHFVATESLTDPLPASVAKMEEIARTMEAAGEMETQADLDIQRINQSIEELTNYGQGNIRFLVNTGMPVSLNNIRQLKATRERKLNEDLAVLNDTELTEVAESLQNSDLSDFAAGATPAELNERLIDHIEAAGDNAKEAEKITKLDIVMQNLNFRKQMLETGSDYSFAMNFNGRIADVAMYVINENMDISQGVTLYLSLKTAMGEIAGLINLFEGAARIRLAANDTAKGFLKQNEGQLVQALQALGMENVDIGTIDSAIMKKHLGQNGNILI